MVCPCSVSAAAGLDVGGRTAFRPLPPAPREGRWCGVEGRGQGEGWEPWNSKGRAHGGPGGSSLSLRALFCKPSRPRDPARGSRSAFSGAFPLLSKPGKAFLPLSASSEAASLRRFLVERNHTFPLPTVRWLMLSLKPWSLVIPVYPCLFSWGKPVNTGSVFLSPGLPPPPCPRQTLCTSLWMEGRLGRQAGASVSHSVTSVSSCCPELSGW